MLDFNREELERLLEWYDEWDFADGWGSGADNLDIQIKTKIESKLKSEKTS